jgi:integrase
MNITKKMISSLPRPSNGYKLHWDEKLKGFGVRITASGVISFIVQKRINKKEHRKTLGRADIFTVEQARNLALTFLGEIASGNDPVARELEERAVNVTLNDVFAEYLKTRKALKVTTTKDMARSLKEMFSKWADKPITNITPDMVKKLHADFGKEHSNARANLGMRYLRTLINFAESEYTDSRGQSVIKDNPVSILTKQKAWFKVEKRRTYIKPTQLKPWFDAVQVLPYIHARDYFILCVLTGLRRTEALDLRWKDIDLREKTLTLHDPKNGEQHVLPLSDYLFNLLKTRFTARVGQYVFEGERGRLSNLRHSLTKVREQSGVNFQIHDLRRTFITVGESLDLSSYAIKKLINHKDGADVTAGYIIIDVERLRSPMQKITDYFLSAWGISDDNVLPFSGEKVINNSEQNTDERRV